MTRRALVIGGSLGGLLSAHLLRRRGWHAVVFERENDLTGRGVGLGTHPQLIAVLRRAGIAFDASMGVTVPKVVCLDRAGNIVIEQPTARTMSGWSRLYRALRSALPAQDYRLAKKLRRIEQDRDGVTAVFEDGTSERGDLPAPTAFVPRCAGNFCPTRNPSMPAMLPGARCWTKHA